MMLKLLQESLAMPCHVIVCLVTQLTLLHGWNQQEKV